jgi:hypothetical protein
MWRAAEPSESTFPQSFQRGVTIYRRYTAYLQSARRIQGYTSQWYGVIRAGRMEQM